MLDRSKAMTRKELLERLKSKESHTSEFFFPVVGAKEQGKIHNLYGTAFNLCGNYFMTAGHCLQNISEEEVKLVLFEHQVGWTGRNIVDSEVFENCDVALFKVEDLTSTDGKFEIKKRKWSSKNVLIFDSVFACGFPHGFDMDTQRISVRGLKGYIVGTNFANRFTKEWFNTIETSFACPKGISGAPLIKSGNDSIIGVVIGNSRISITTHENREYHDDGTSVTLYEAEETTRLGEVVSFQTISELESRLLGMKVGEFLQSKDLINA